eukprot:TRINITY_DN1366_c0_g2_i1.p1 TRINITY_DN1366_c0_g2~~TRINITY_DN1366_c0_g2_i1.p1  ORF type:complete len:1267 (+),score=201.95 TRINITY_DN1366_c0_g2_i1:151-3951(+)
MVGASGTPAAAAVAPQSPLGARPSLMGTGSPQLSPAVWQSRPVVSTNSARAAPSQTGMYSSGGYRNPPAIMSYSTSRASVNAPAATKASDLQRRSPMSGVASGASFSTGFNAPPRHSSVVNMSPLGGSYVAMSSSHMLEGVASEGGVGRAWRACSSPTHSGAKTSVDPLSRSLIDCPTFDIDPTPVLSAPILAKPAGHHTTSSASTSAASGTPDATPEYASGFRSAPSSVPAPPSAPPVATLASTPTRAGQSGTVPSSLSATVPSLQITSGAELRQSVSSFNASATAEPSAKSPSASPASPTPSFQPQLQLHHSALSPVQQRRRPQERGSQDRRPSMSPQPQPMLMQRHRTVRIPQQVLAQRKTQAPPLRQSRSPAPMSSSAAAPTSPSASPPASYIPVQTSLAQPQAQSHQLLQSQPSLQPLPPQWAASQSLRIAAVVEVERFFGNAKLLLDTKSVFSVNSAASQLNSGAISCPEGLCIVYSQSSSAYFLLYRQDMREVAHEKASEATEASRRQQAQLAQQEAQQQESQLQQQASQCQSSASQAQSQKQPQSQSTARTQQPQTQDKLMASMTSISGDLATSRTRRQSTEDDPVENDRLSGTQRSRPGGASASSAATLTAPLGDVSPAPPRSAAAPATLPATPTTPQNQSLSLRTPQAATGERDGLAASRRSIDRVAPVNIFTPRSRSKQALSSRSSARRPSLGATSPLPRQSTRTEGSSSAAPQSPEGKSSATTNGAAAAAAAAASPAATKRQTNNELDIGNRRFKIDKVIGRGAFGVVYNAQDRSGEVAAVKVVSAKDAPGYATATFEAELLQILTASLHGRCHGHVPQYIAHSAQKSSSSSSNGGGTVRLAMSFCDGGAVDKWLYGISDEEHKAVNVQQLVEGRLPGGQQRTRKLASAASLVTDLLRQLAGVLAALEPIAFHRDISSHNVLLHFPDDPSGAGDSTPTFALIDFGLAVRSGSWNRQWRSSNLAGDPRYWTPSAWMAFAFGFKYVATHPSPGFQQQYLTRMDHFSMGVLGLETLFALWDTNEANGGKCPGLMEARAAWCRYWVPVVRLFQMFHRHGPTCVRQFLAQSQDEGVTSLVTNLRQLRSALRSSATNSQNKAHAPLLLLLADLIDEQGQMQWNEVAAELGEQRDQVRDARTSSSASHPDDAESTGRGRQPQQSGDRRAAHRRIRSTGGTLDQELRRIEPEAAGLLPQRSFRPTPGSPATATQHYGASPIVSHGGLSPGGCHTLGSFHGGFLSVDPLSRSFSHARHVSGYA